jgi:nitrogen fixation/metabolism regulation signal transduction histidine kinase
MTFCAGLRETQHKMYSEKANVRKGEYGMKIEDDITKEFLNNILASMEGGLFTIDKEAKITSFNRAAEKILN